MTELLTGKTFRIGGNDYTVEIVPKLDMQLSVLKIDFEINIIPLTFFNFQGG